MRRMHHSCSTGFDASVCMLPEFFEVVKAANGFSVLLSSSIANCFVYAIASRPLDQQFWLLRAAVPANFQEARRVILPRASGGFWCNIKPATCF